MNNATRTLSRFLLSKGFCPSVDNAEGILIYHNLVDTGRKSFQVRR